jgi:hypothetical protein
MLLLECSYARLSRVGKPFWEQMRGKVVRAADLMAPSRFFRLYMVFLNYSKSLVSSRSRILRNRVDYVSIYQVAEDEETVTTPSRTPRLFPNQEL